MAEAEAWGATNGWTTDRHIAFPTVDTCRSNPNPNPDPNPDPNPNSNPNLNPDQVDVPIANLPKLQRLWKERLFARTLPLSRLLVSSSLTTLTLTTYCGRSASSHEP